MLTSESVIIVRVSKPAPASSTTDTATCATTSVRCNRCLHQAAAHPPHAGGHHGGERSFLRQERRERQHQRHQHRQAEREAQRHGVETNLRGARRIPRRERHEQSHSADGHRDAEDRAEEREHQILDEQQPTQPADARAERRADDELVLAPHAAHQCEIGDVRSRDDHHERGGRHQQPECESRALAKRLFERKHGDAEVRARIIRLLEFTLDA